jgi:signal transduction histidine kinase
VFGGQRANDRRAGIERLYAVDASLVEADGAALGHEEISRKVEQIAAQVPAKFSFVPIQSPITHHGMGVLRWRLEGPEGHMVMTGVDVALFSRGRIQAVHVFLTPQRTFRAALNDRALVDRKRVRRVVTHLIENAIKYTTSFGRVRLSLNRVGEAVTLRVEDNGIGFPATACLTSSI